MYALEAKEMCKRVERICQVDPDGWYAPVIGKELVRCRDCVHFKKARTEEEYDACGILYEMFDSPLAVNEEDFCSQADRK